MTSLPDLSTVHVEGRRLAVRHRAGKTPTILFLPGYASDMEGAKAVAIDAFAATRGLACLRFDYSGTGASDGDFADGTMDRWLGETLHMIDSVARRGPVVLVGSSMGGWLALLAALRRPTRVAGLLGIAAAPDFTHWGFGPAEREMLRDEGRIEEDNPFGPEPSVTHYGFWASGQELRLLEGPIPIRAPVRLVHGDEDGDVPVRIALRTLKALTGDAQLRLIRGGGHRLSEPGQIAAILEELAALVDKGRR